MSRSGAEPIGGAASPYQFGAVGDGVTYDDAAITAAINAAGVGGRVDITGPAGRRLVWGSSSPLTLLGGQHLTGPSQTFGLGGGGYNGEIFFPNIGAGAVAVSAGAGGTSVLSYVRFRGPGAGSGAIGVGNTGAANSTIKFRACHFYDWGIGAQLNASYYSSFDECEFRHNDVDLDCVGMCYNLSLNDCRFDGSNSFSTYGTTIRVDNIESLNIHGGSIESYGSSTDTTPHAGILHTNKTTRSSIRLYGVYFESAATAATGIDIAGTTGASVSVFGAEVALSNHNYWIRTTGAKAGGVLYARGNTFFGSSSNTASPVAYGIDNPPSMQIDIADDTWQAGGIAGATYGNGFEAVNNPGVAASIPSAYNGSGATAKVWKFIGRGVKIPSGYGLGIGGQAIYYGTAAPTTGTYALGDRVFNSSPAVGSPKSWVCTVAGTPGTWVSEGNL